MSKSYFDTSDLLDFQKDVLIEKNFIKKPVVFACIPAFNEALVIGSLIVNAKDYVDEIVVCDDGSSDSTSKVVEKFDVHLINNEKNSGKGVALRNLFNYALKFNPDIIVVLDADGQHDPNEIPKLIEPIIKKEADVVIGSRFIEGSSTDAPLYRKFGLAFFNLYPQKNLTDIQSGFRAFTNKASKIMLRTETKGFGIETEQVDVAFKNNLKITEVPIHVKYKGIIKPSKLNPILHGLEILGTMIRLSAENRPILFLGVPAFVSMWISILSGIMLLNGFNVDKTFDLILFVIFLSSLSIGTIFSVSSLVLYSVSRTTTKLTLKVVEQLQKDSKEEN